MSEAKKILFYVRGLGSDSSQPLKVASQTRSENIPPSVGGTWSGTSDRKAGYELRFKAKF